MFLNDCVCVLQCQRMCTYVSVMGMLLLNTFQLMSGYIMNTVCVRVTVSLLYTVF